MSFAPVEAAADTNVPADKSIVGPAGMATVAPADKSIVVGASEPTIVSPAPILIGDAFNQTFLRSPRAAAARATLAVAKAALWKALTLPNPGFEYDLAHAELTYRHGFFIPVEAPWSIFFRTIAAKKQITQADLQIVQTLWVLRGDVRRQYTQLVVNQETSFAYQELYQITKVLSDSTQARFSFGDVPRLDVFRAQLAMEQAELQWQQALRNVVMAKEQLNVVMGREPAESIDVPRLPDNFIHPNANYLLPDLSTPLLPESHYQALAMAHKPDLLVVQQQIAVARADLRVALGNMWPNSQISFGKSIVVNPGQPNTTGLYATGSLTVPVFNWNQGEISRLKATVRQLQFELRSQQNIVTSQVSLAYRKLWNDRETLRTYINSLLPHSQHVVDLAQQSYKFGQSDITAVLQAQQANIQIRTQYYNEVLAYQQAFTDLEQAVGTPLQ